MSSNIPVLIDVSRLIWRGWRGQLPTGIDRACLAYVAHYRDHARAVVQRGGLTHTLGENDTRKLFALLVDGTENFRADLVKVLARSFLAKAIPQRRAFAGVPYLNVGHTGLDRRGHARWVSRTGVIPIYYVHDLIPITHPQYARRGEPERHADRIATILRHGKGVIANSHDSIAQLTEFAEGRGFPMPPALRAPLGVEAFANVQVMNPPIPDSYFVILGTIEGRKNHALLFDLWRQLAARLGEGTPKLVIIGQRGWAAGEIIEALDGDSALRPHVIELGRCSDGELKAWLAHARALLFPSFVEGQGLPMIEALAMKTPVIASDLSVFRETAGDIPDYRDPSDLAGWIDAIWDYCSLDSPLRSAQLDRMAGFRPSTWDEHFQAVDQWLLDFCPVGYSARSVERASFEG